MTREVTASISIQSPDEGATNHNSFGSAGCVVGYSYIQLNGDTTNPHPNEEVTNQEEPDLSDNSSRESVTPLPIALIAGEKTEETADFVDCRIVLTNFRLCILSLQDQLVRVISLMSIEYVNFADPVQISIVCKDGKSYRLSAMTNELAIHWHKRLMKCTSRTSADEAFAWEFANAITKENPSWLVTEEDRDTCKEEWDLLEYDPDYFKISDENKDHSLIETYPSRIVVPKWMEKEDIKEVKNYRALGRIPVIVYVYKETKAVLLRSSQPKTGFLAWREIKDEKILHSVNEFSRRYYKEGNDKDFPENVIFDARSYPAAWANRAKGGGFENPENYGNAKQFFLGLPNIHTVRYAFSQLRTVLSAECHDQNTYLQSVSQTQWLQHLGLLISASNECVDWIMKGTSILVHCSDGWDRTTQIVSLAKLFIDDRYRTLKGFELLIRREWIEFGHKFADRTGVYGSDTNERCPVFLQFLDAVWQAWKQNPTAFEFNRQYIIKLAQHVYSGMFGNFLFNSVSDSIKNQKGENREKKPVSIWQFLGNHNEEVVNQSYDPGNTAGRINVNPGVQFLDVWKEFYYTESLKNQTIVVSSPPFPRSAASTPLKEMANMQKSKSSDSINSLVISESMQASSLMAAHSEQNGPLADSSIHPNDSSNILTESMCLKRDGYSRSVRDRKQNVKDMVDYDGMIKFYDPQQEVARRIKQEKDLEIDKMKGTIDDLKRHRSFSERTTASSGNRYRVISGDESEPDNMSIGTDTSVVDLNEVSCTDGPGWSIRSQNCALCRVEFKRNSYRTEDREHHCRKCGKAVCEMCSRHNYHEPYQGKGVLLRACNRCYKQMEMNKGNEEDEEIGGRPRSRTDTMMKIGGDDSFGSLGSGSLTQPVKG